ncbi:DUF3138 family protein [Roseateles koreensis]|uniref:DUF3138 family protein n=1 Tax=Roseateles koreensis TaxID=2987526 RepID=A0ABT5KN30_9BURK|nr:DUF3138 family protein [Roseateles koreensis]MDC8784242.1 DUF3138 family protein [Roseateles koreensis]
MNQFKLSALALGVAMGLPLPSFAQTAPTDNPLRKELLDLQARMAELEKRLQSAESNKGMTPEQQQDFNRIAVKAEALEDSRDFMGMKNLKISGYFDLAYVYNQAQDRAGFQFINPVQSGGYGYDNSYFGMAMLDFLKETDSGTRWHLTLAPNRGAGAIIDGSSIVHEASVSVPLTDLQTRLIAGQIPDWSGYEFVPAPQTKLVSHNLLFDFTLPVSYTGIGVDIVRGKWETKALLANMNASLRTPHQKAPVLAYRVDYSKGEFDGFGFAGVHGNVANYADGGGSQLPDSRLDTFEFDAYFIRGDLTLQGQMSIGRQKNAAITLDPVTGEHRDAQWWGASTLMAYKFQPTLEGIVRLDYLNNEKNGGGLLGYASSDGRNGIGPGWSYDSAASAWTQTNPERGANRTALTVGANFNFNANTTFKLEYRSDFASEAVFFDARSNGYRKTNHLLGGAMVVSF